MRYLFIILFTMFLPFSGGCGTSTICPSPLPLSKKENRLLAKQVLNLLGITKRPPKIPQERMTYGAKFMLELYKVVQERAEDGNRIRRTLPSLRTDEIYKTEMSDVVVSMSCVDKKSLGQKLKLEFSLDSVPKKAKLIGAELKLFQTSQQIYNMFLITVYRGKKMKKMVEKVISTGYDGWLSMDISTLFNYWLHNPLASPVLYLTVHPYEGDFFKEHHPATIGLDLLENEPFIIAYLHANNQVNMRFPRDVSLETRARDLHDLFKQERCGMKTLKVSFHQLGWSDWVIAPEGYTTYFCQGPCDFPIKYPNKATNHAIIQSFMNLKNPGKFPKPSCAATETSQLSVLYKQRENTILKNYKNMIVRKCGCQ
ncbi:bone morphogenetic protein 7-like [Anthonomus grandis grandis]|uniref:bone morphogenetic protein 7-like n=1 Tax=Anthonomus grandis grandis TaxID=2921223 RepID=UPI0021666F8A|nr:bone morphogenetic protein 7-like [Anthonomus grandis grandis]